MLEGLRGEDSIAELCQQEAFAKSLYCEWFQEFLQASKKRLAGDTERKAISRKGKEPCQDIGDPKKAFTEILLENGIPPKSMIAFARKSSRRAVVSGSCNTPAALQCFS